MPRRCPPRCALPSFVAGIVASACTGTGTGEAPSRAFHGDVVAVAAGPRDTVQPATPPAAGVAAPGPVPDQDDGAAWSPAAERELRHRLATAADPTDAALTLAAQLAALERCDDALAVLDAALARAPSAPLRIARAGVCRDLARRADAVAELRVVRGEAGAKALHPRLLFELAELEWLAGDGASAASTLRELATVHAGDPWLDEHRAERQELAANAASAAPPRELAVRDLLANLRGVASATARLTTLEQLVRGDGLPDEARVEVRARAVAIALGDASPALRARAVQLTEIAPEHRLAFCRQALADREPLVRRFAVRRCQDLPRADALALLLGHLRDEPEPAVWRAAHAVLRHFQPAIGDYTEVRTDTARDRAVALAAWQATVSP